MFASDDELVQEICHCNDELQLGVVLISPRDACLACGGKLYIRAQHSSSVVIYDDCFGTMAATHYVKYCRRQSCSLQQYYGFYMQGSVSEVHYNEDWHTLPHFMSSRETAITMDFLRRFDKEILIGQISYKQRADIYNEVHGCGGGHYAKSDNAYSSSISAYTEIIILCKLLACLIKPKNIGMLLTTLYLYLLWNFLPSSTHNLIHTSRHDLNTVVQRLSQLSLNYEPWHDYYNMGLLNKYMVCQTLCGSPNYGLIHLEPFCNGYTFKSLMCYRLHVPIIAFDLVTLVQALHNSIMIPHSRKMLRQKIFAKPSYLFALQKHFICTNMVKVISFYAVINSEEKTSQ